MTGESEGVPGKVERKKTLCYARCGIRRQRALSGEVKYSRLEYTSSATLGDIFLTLTGSVFKKTLRYHVLLRVVFLVLGTLLPAVKVLSIPSCPKSLLVTNCPVWVSMSFSEKPFRTFPDWRCFGLNSVSLLLTQERVGRLITPAPV